MEIKDFATKSRASNFKARAERLGWTVSTVFPSARGGFSVVTNCPYNF